MKEAFTDIRAYVKMKHNLSAVTGFAVVYLVCKNGGTDDGTLYAMKVMEKKNFDEEDMLLKRHMMECHTFETVRGAPFFVRLHYSFETESEYYLVMGEYIKNHMRCIHMKGRFNSLLGVTKQQHLTNSE
jgi:hypothetical protein